MSKGMAMAPGVEAFRVLEFAAKIAHGTESEPLRLGNAEFWIGTEPWGGELCFYPTSNQWDKEVQAALTAFLEPHHEALVQYLLNPNE